MDTLARGGLEPLDTECLRPHYARTLWCWVDALESQLDEARRVLGDHADRVLRAYRLYLAGSAMGFEQGWISLFQILGSRPNGVVETRSEDCPRIRAAQSDYPFRRDYMYARPAAAARTERQAEILR